MSGIPNDIPGFGSVKQLPRQNPEFDPIRLSSFTSEDYYVWSRIDGTASLRDLILMIGFDAAKTIDILRRLREFGALLMADETPQSVKKRQEEPAAAAPKPERKANGSGGSSSQAVADDLDLETLTDAERDALAEEVVLTSSQKQRVLSTLRKLRTVDHFTLFGLEIGADKKEVKRAYFRLSKEFHPDRFYGKNLGSFGPWLSSVFEYLTSAFEVLSHPKTRDAYIAALRGETPPSSNRGVGEQSRADYARDLFDRACSAETSGKPEDAMQFFSAAVRMDPKSRYLRRAATCAVVAGQLSTAEEYAKKAADLQRQDPSYARVLADVYRASGKWGEAEEILVRALELKTENDVLTSELHADLAEVRRMQSS